METEQYLQIKRSVKSVLRIDLDHYKDEQMRRRLDSWLVRSGAPDWPAYFKRINVDSQELARFRDYLTINVSGFFRDVERWQALEKDVLPRLLAENRRAAFERRQFNVWSAGCSTGPEPYTLAMMFNELFGRFSYHILATD
ncbi:MAG TPA: CheR family methyltransferase, partial [Anaerolineales bacterium]|nr:CheR family methyltransferase [Anaerolineales bacterium]